MTRETIGCSELGALFDADPRCTRRHLYLRLIGEAPERVTTAPMLVGQVFEAAIAEWYVERHPGYRWDVKYARHTDTPIFRGRLHGHPDGLITVAGESEPSINGEIKIPYRHAWREVPLHYQWQAQGQMALTGFRACVVVECLDMDVRGSGREIVHLHCREWLVERDESVHAAILEECERFFVDHVIPRVPPPAVAEDLDDLKAQPPQPGVEITLDDNIESHVSVWRTIRAEIAEAEARARKLKAEADDHHAIVLEAMGSAAAARLPNGAVIERRARHRREFVMPASTSYHLSYKEPKK